MYNSLMNNIVRQCSLSLSLSWRPKSPWSDLHNSLLPNYIIRFPTESLKNWIENPKIPTFNEKWDNKFINDNDLDYRIIKIIYLKPRFNPHIYNPTHTHTHTFRQANPNIPTLSPFWSKENPRRARRVKWAGNLLPSLS